MLLVNRLLSSVFDLLMRPLQRVGVMAGLAVVSLFTAIAILFVVRITSDQQAIAAVKRQIHADLFEMRLFNDDLGAILRAALKILRHTAMHLRLSLPPLVCALVPAALVVAQLQSFFGYAGLNIGEPVVISAQVKAGHQLASLDAPPEIRVETPAIWVPALNQIVWRIVPTAPGDYQMRMRIADGMYNKSIHVSDGLARRSPARLEPRLLTEIVYPSEAPLPDDAPISEIRIDYPKGDIKIFGRPVHWLVMYAVVSVAFAALLKRPLRVEI
jgi:hypothetical protein